MGPPPLPLDEAVGAYTQPYIVHFKDADEDEDCLQQYFISVEHSLMLETHSFTSAVFAVIAAYYVFNLSYHNKCTDFWTFIQEYVLDLPAKGSKKSPTSAVHSAGIKRIFTEDHKEDED